MEELKCRNEGQGRCKGEVTIAPDPFAQEIHNDNSLVEMCEECRYQSVMDV